MKKAVAIISTLLLCFVFYACDNNETSEIINDVTEKIAQTILTVYSEKSEDIVEIKLYSNDEGSAVNEYKKLSDADAGKTLNIINNHQPETVEAGSDCLFFYRLRINGTEYAYHSDCGSLETVTSGICKTVKLTEEEKSELNSIFIKYFPHSSPCIRVYETEATSTTDYDLSEENICFTLKKSTYGAAEFALNMMKEAIKQESNALISPVSLISALSMTANGAKGETLAEFEKVLGSEIEQLNRDFSKSSIDGEGVKTANSIWVKDTPSLKIKQSFINLNKKHYGAEVYKEDFSNSTLNKINRWVSDNTDGLIKNGLDEISSDAVMYLINTVLFDAEWKNKFNSNQIIRNQNFTSENGETQKVTMLSDEFAANDDNYFTLGKTEGIIMDYTNGYSFAALLPDEGTSISQALNSFSGNQLANTLVKRHNTEKTDGTFLILTKVPKFEFDCSFKFGKTLANLGMPLAFNPMKADFSGISDSSVYPLYISEVYHNTKISFTENGTKAGAATYVEMKFGSARPPESVKKLYFDRPFIYIIFKTNTGLPLFMGTVRDFNK